MLEFLEYNFFITVSKILWYSRRFNFYYQLLYCMHVAYTQSSCFAFLTSSPIVSCSFYWIVFSNCSYTESFLTISYIFLYWCEIGPCLYLRWFVGTDSSLRFSVVVLVFFFVTLPKYLEIPYVLRLSRTVSTVYLSNFVFFSRILFFL